MPNIHGAMSYIFVLLYHIYCILSSPNLPEHIHKLAAQVMVAGAVAHRPGLPLATAGDVGQWMRRVRI
jgi:hypothetical protein